VPSFFEWTRTSFEESLAEFYIILFEEHLKSCFRDVESWDMFPNLVSKTGQSGSVMLNLVTGLAREDAEVHLHALQTITEHFQLCG
jgi:hypothetical protein